MLQIAEHVRVVLLPFLAVTAALLVVLLASLAIQRIVREIAWRRRQTLLARYRPIVDGVTHVAPTPLALARLRGIRSHHRAIVSELLLAPLHAARGDIVVHAREAAASIGLIGEWLDDLRHSPWWRRAHALRGLGFVEERPALQEIHRCLDDPHGEVRAAAVEAAGHIGDARSIPALLDHLGEGAHVHQQVRMVDALRRLGPAVTPALVEFGRSRPGRAQLAAQLLGLIGTVAAIGPLLEWCGDTRADVRAAALRALGSMGLDDRSHYFALRALGDPDAEVRAMAARALGRGHREDSAGYLAARLDDAWLPAAHAAGALRRLGAAGRAALQARARDEGQAGNLARQMLW